MEFSIDKIFCSLGGCKPTQKKLVVTYLGLTETNIFSDQPLTENEKEWVKKKFGIDDENASIFFEVGTEM